MAITGALLLALSDEITETSTQARGIALDLFGSSLPLDPTTDEREHAITRLHDFVEPMCRHQHRPAVRSQRADLFTEFCAGDRVEAPGGLVEHE